MTLNDLERRNSPYFAFFLEFDCFPGQLRHSLAASEKMITEFPARL